MTVFNRFLLLLLSLCLLAPAFALTTGTVWVRPAKPGDPLIWGRRDGLIFGIPSKGGMRGPRGLIRVGIMGGDGEPELINFIAIEPVIKGTGPRNNRMALSELEMSTLDPGRQGKRLFTNEPMGDFTTSPAESLSVTIDVEPFTANHAHVYLVATVFAEHPDELELSVHNHDNSPPIDQLTVTATMGNYERLRHLWLKDTIVDSDKLYEDYIGLDFVEKKTYPLKEMLRWNGDPIAMASPGDDDPSSDPVVAHPSWRYTSRRLTQYWRIPADDVQPDLSVRVNGRRVYWKSIAPVPGGPAFENFELRQSYAPGQRFIFGLIPKQPWEMKPGIQNLHPPIQPARSKKK